MSRSNTNRVATHKAFALSAISAALLSVGFSGAAWAGPTGGTVVGGTVSIGAASNVGGKLTTIITQSSAKGIINWNDFSIANGELVKFMQLNAHSVILNRVTGAAQSNIQGDMQANGRVFLLNPNGIVFGAGSSIDVGGLLATTLNVVDDDAFMNDGLLSFTSPSGSAASIVNQGQITVGANGFVYLVAPSVDNAGTITANVASVTLAAGNRFSVNLSGGDLINFDVSADALTDTDNDLRTGVANSGTITAQHVLLSGNEVSGLMSSVVNNSGVIEATTLDINAGDIAQSGAVNVTDTASLTAARTITTGDTGSTRAHVLNLEVTADGASIGAEDAALRVDADTLNAKAVNGHVIVTDTAGGVALGEVTTGAKDNRNLRRALITSEGGDITSADPSKTNVTAWSTNLVASGAIGSDLQSVTTDVDVLGASTADGSIAIRDVGDQVLLAGVKANQVAAGQAASLSAMSDADGNITLTNKSVGNKNISISTVGDLFVGGEVSTGNAVSLASDTGSIFSSGDAAVVTGKTVNLSAGKAVGIDGGALKLQSEVLNAQSGDGGVFVHESNGLAIGTVTAAGTSNDVSVSLDQGALKLGSITATGGTVSLSTSSGGGVTDNNGVAQNVSAAHLAINASGAVGTSADSIDTAVGTLDVASSGVLAGLYLNNSVALTALTAATLNGDVSVAYTGGQLAFNHNNSQLTVSGSNAMDLAFANEGGSIEVTNGLDVGSQNTVALSSLRAITQSGSNPIVAKSITLDAGADIGSANTALQTRTEQLNATSDAGIINIADASTGTLTVTARATGAAGTIALTHAGDLAVDLINAKGNVSLSATGKIEVVDPDAGAAVSAGAMQLQAAQVGSAQAAFSSAVAGPVSIASAGDVNYANTGALSALDVTAQGDVAVNNFGDVALGKLQAGNAITFTGDGAVTDGNAGADNIVANAFTGTAGSLGTSGDAIETRIGSLTVNTTGGGIYASNLGGQALALVSAASGGSGGDIDIANEGDIALGVVTSGGNVTLKGGGSIEDARANGSTASNVTARNLTMSADGGIGQDGDLALDVTQLAASGGSGGVNAANVGAIAVDASTLEGKGSSGVSITATDIAILDNHGGTITMDPGGNLVLTATDGGIVFLNQDDTIYLPGGGSITLTAIGKSELDGYNGAIIVGNLKTDGGAIKLEAQSNITIGMLDAGATGDVAVIARNGVILDGNRSQENIRGNHVVLEAHTPSQRDAEITRNTAIADYSGKQGELNSKLSALEGLIQELQQYEAQLQRASSQQQQADLMQGQIANAVAGKSAEVEVAKTTLDALNTALKAATVVRNAAAFVAGAAQAVPLSGDAGAAAAFAAIDVALSVADLALDAFERYSFNPLAGDLDALNNDLDQAQAALTDSITNMRMATVIRDTTKTSEQMAQLAVFKATVAFGASTQLRKQAVAAYDLNKDIDSSVDKPLGVSANKLDIIGSGTDGALNSGLYLNTAGSLGLGDVTVASGTQISAAAGQDISVVGTVHSDTAIGLNAGRSILGAGGVLVTPDLTAVAGQGIGTNQAVNTQVSTLAAAGGAGGVNISNRTQALITIGELGAVQGVSGAGDITLDTDGDLKIDKLVKDSSGTHTVTLITPGAIIDGNDVARNVQGGELVVNAGKSVDLDTEMAGLTATLSGTGDLNVRDTGDLVARQVQAHDGKIDIQATGNLTVGNVAADAATGAISLAAGGRIDDDQDAGTGISGDHLTLTAGSSIGANGGKLATRVNSLDGTANDDIQIAEADDLSVGTLQTTQGDVYLGSADGSLSIGNIATRTDGDSGNTITLVAGRPHRQRSRRRRRQSRGGQSELERRRGHRGGQSAERRDRTPGSRRWHGRHRAE